MNSGIYIIKNKTNGKIYIGSSKNIPKRKWAHFNDLRNGKHSNEHLQRSFDKYGEEEFVFETIFKIPSGDFAELDEKEKHYIKHHDSLNDKKGYNLTEGGRKCKFTKAHRKKLSISHIGKKHTEETKRKISKHSSTRHPSDETKIKISKNHAHYWTGKKMSDETRTKMRHSSTHHWKGKHISEQAKQKFKETMNNKSPEELAEIRRKISETVKKRWKEGVYDNKKIRKDSLTLRK